jgi:Holliday junction resolvasome RuvABC endonuclease subunit
VRWLGLDPSIAGFGWACFEDEKLIECGTWKTKPNPKAKRKLDDRADRINELGLQLVHLVDNFCPKGAAIESITIGPAQSRVTASVLGRVRGLTEGICLARRVGLIELIPQTVKRRWCGAHNASKESVAIAVRRLFPVAAAGVGLDATDAVAVGWAARADLLGALQLITKPNYNPPPAAAPAGDDLGF